MEKKRKYEILNVSFPKTMENFSPDDKVYTCIGEFDMPEPYKFSMWKSAYKTEAELRKHCFWFGTGWVSSPAIAPPQVLELTADEFVKRSYKEDPRGMNPFETLNKIQFMLRWNLKK